MKKTLICLLFPLHFLSCATSIPLKDPSSDLTQSANPVILVQYHYDAEERGTTSLYFRDTSGKEFRVMVPKEVDTEAGVFFELPTTEGVRLYRFSHPDASQPTALEQIAPAFYPKNGKINHVGFFNFKYDRNTLFVNPLNAEDAMKMFNKGLAAHHIARADVINAYTGKPMPEKNDNGVAHFQTSTPQPAKMKFEDKIWKCHTEEDHRNLIVMGTLRFHVNVVQGHIQEVTVANSNHTATQDYEACSENALKQADVSDGSFTADVPAIF